MTITEDLLATREVPRVTPTGRHCRGHAFGVTSDISARMRRRCPHPMCHRIRAHVGGHVHRAAGRHRSDAS